MRPGRTGNPNGRPRKGESLAEMITFYANKKDPATDDKLRYKESIAKKLVEMAAAGDIKFMAEYFDRTVGRPRQAVEHGGGMDIRVVIDWRDGTTTADQPIVPGDGKEPEAL